MKQHRTLTEMTLCALFAAVLCICSPISVPVGPVPLSLGVFAVMLCAATLPLRTALLSVTVFLLLGLFLPIFTGARTGLDAMTGVTGGYIWSYALMVPVIRVFAGMPVKRPRLRYAAAFLGCVLSLGVCYSLGTFQFVRVAGVPVRNALELCVLPFLLPDLGKAAAAAALSVPLRGALARLWQNQG